MLVELKDFSFTYYAQEQPSLRSISLTIAEGEKCAIVGPSGCGKSTLIHLLNGLIPHHFPGQMTGFAQVAGTVICDGTRDDESGLDSITDRSRRVGTVLQDPDGQFIGLTVAEDLAFALENELVSHDQMHEQVHQIAARVGMEDFLDASPQFLSGGQKQRVTLGGVLVAGATSLLLCDEPLAALDPAAGMDTIDLLDQIHRNNPGQAIIIVEHRLEDLLYRDLDRIIVMHRGRIVHDCTPDELFAMGVLERYGVRSPLYINALSYAGVDVASRGGLDSVHRLELAPDDAQALAQLVDETPAPEPAERPTLLSLHDICFTYRRDEKSSERQILFDVDLDVKAGEMISICGANGAGKSTLAKIICGFERPSSGTLSFHHPDGTIDDIGDQSIAQRAGLVGYVLQDPNHMISQPTVTEEVGLALYQGALPHLAELSDEEKRERIEQALRICGLYPYRNWPISVLSYGQKKRVTIASVLVSRPSIIILDEPTAGQDWAHYTEIMEFLAELNDQGYTIILITHDMHLALEYTHRTVVLADGKVLTFAPCSHILTDPELSSAAHLKMTSLYYLAHKAGITPPSALVDAFIVQDRRRRPTDLLERISVPAATDQGQR